MAAPRSLSRPQNNIRSTPQNQGRIANGQEQNQKPASTKEAEARESVQEEQEAPQAKGSPKTAKKGGAKGKSQVGDDENLLGIDGQEKRQAPGYSTGFDADELDVQARSGVKTGAARSAPNLLPHSPAALMHKLQAPQSARAPRNKVNDLATFAATEQVGDLDTFGADLQDLVQKVEAGAYRNRDVRVPLSKLEFPKDRELFALFTPDSQQKGVPQGELQDTKGARHALLDLMQRLSDGCGEAVILPSWPVRVRELNALWQMQGAMLKGDVDEVKKWATTLLKQTPESPFAAYAKEHLQDANATTSETSNAASTDGSASISAVKDALQPGSDVEKLCLAFKNLAKRVMASEPTSASKKGATFTSAQLTEELTKLPDPEALDVTALWTDAGDALRQDFHQGLQTLAAHHPDVAIYGNQTLKEASMYADVLELQYSVAHGRGKDADLLDVTQAFVDAFPSSERAQWITQLAAE